MRSLDREKIVQNFAGNRSDRSLERDKMRIISLWTIRNYDTRFLDKMLKMSGEPLTFPDLFFNLVISVRQLPPFRYWVASSRRPRPSASAGTSGRAT